MDNQHYVPQFILRNFASGRNKQIHVFEKATEKSFKTAVRNIASENGFYDFESDGLSQSLDPLLTKLEVATNNIIRTLVQARNLQCLNSGDRAMLALFTAVQMLRTDAKRKQFKGLHDSISDAIKRIGGDPHKVQGFTPVDEEQLRTETIRMIPELARDLTPHIVNKSWILYSTPPRQTFYISDNPVTLHNTVNQDPLRGTLGLAVEGIEVYLPLSRTLCLGFLCPTIEEKIRTGHKAAITCGLTIPLDIQSFIKALDGEETLPLVPLSVIHHNSLQVLNAERYVFSGDGDFSLVREMLQVDPALKGGPRYR